MSWTEKMDVDVLFTVAGSGSAYCKYTAEPRSPFGIQTPDCKVLVTVTGSEARELHALLALSIYSSMNPPTHAPQPAGLIRFFALCFHVSRAAPQKHRHLL